MVRLSNPDGHLIAVSRRELEGALQMTAFHIQTLDSPVTLKSGKAVQARPNPGWASTLKAGTEVRT